MPSPAVLAWSSLPTSPEPLGPPSWPPEIQAGPQVNAARTSNLLFAVGGGIISLVAVVFSLLFLTVQFASTTLSPRLNLFRDEPLVWHAFGLFVGVFVFATPEPLRTSTRE